MVIYIKENEIVTELEYSQELKDELVALGFKAVTVDDKDEPSYYKYEFFEKVNGVWKFIPQPEPEPEPIYPQEEA